MLKKDSSFVEASLVLLVIFATLAYFVIFVQMSALIAILIVWFCCKVSKRSLVFQDDSYLSRDS